MKSTIADGRWTNCTHHLRQWPSSIPFVNRPSSIVNAIVTPSFPIRNNRDTAPA
jgi:hypothetical protein